jgi:lipoprotein-anchoring transpeptidase ErfK/SrfK
VLKMLAAVVIAAGLACAAAPAAERSHAIAAGVSVGGVPVGGTLSEAARSRIEAEFKKPVTLVYRRTQTLVAPSRVGARVDISAAVRAALAATPGSRIALPIRYSQRLVAAAVKRIADRIDRAPVAARVTGATAAGPEFTAARPGLAVDQKTMRAALVQVLAGGQRVPLQVLTRPVPAKVTIAAFGPVIVITRGINKLRLYNGTTLVRTFSVATGQAIYPTPSGVWRIVDKQRNPWWYPPTQDAWARGLKPVPPGPTNPLGTRWMGLSAAGVGIHGTDADTSIGYSASHGCIRMHVPDAEWVFERVHVGTPVVIL